VGTVTVHGKGGHADVLPVGFQRFRAPLELHLLEVERQPDEFLLFPRSQRTWPMDRSTLHRWFKRLERAGLPPDVKMHELRHTAARALYESTGDLVLTQHLRRHEEVRTTRGYVRDSLERLRQAQTALETSWK
jgi:site-specific recombinase XerC